MISETHFQTVLDLWSDEAKKSTCTIQGNCMSPMIKEGETLVIEHGAHNVRWGDVIVFGKPGTFLVHRVIKAEQQDDKRYYIVKPDRDPIAHKRICQDEILGRVVEVLGESGNRHLDSFFWRCSNRLLAIRSLISSHRTDAHTPFWRMMNFILATFSRMLPNGYSLSLMLWNNIHRAYRTRETLQKSGFVGKGRQRNGRNEASAKRRDSGPPIRG